MLISSLSKVLLCIFVYFIRIKIASLQSTEPETQISAISEEIRSYRFALAQEQISKLKDNTKIPQIIHEAYQNEEDSFDVILEFIKALTRVDLAFFVLKALRNEMVANAHGDPMKLIPLAKTFAQHVVFQKNNDEIIKAESENIIKQIRGEVKNAAVEILSEAMFSSKYYLNDRSKILAKEIFNFYYDLSDEIMRLMVNRTYSYMPAVQIVEIIMRSSKFIPQKLSVFLEVFRKLENDNDLNNDAVLKIASCIKQLKDENNYINLFHNQKYDVNLIIDRLPTCARNLYFANEICIWNRGKSEYLYADTSQNYSSRRSVYTSAAEALKTREGSWVGAKTFDDFLFKSQAYKKEYLDVTRHKYESLGRYAQTNERLVDDETESNIWKIELLGEYCFLKNLKFDEYLYASNQMHYRRERYVFSASATAPIDPIDFQWQIRDCS